MTLMGAIKQLRELQSAEDMPIYYKPVIAEVINVLLMDTEEVIHGHWVTDGIQMDDGEYLMTRCSVCGTPYEYGHNDNYCGYCKAKMDEVTE